tara:strand:- start:472 stop:804 length:333 start_codon:yes stop_codon:yes gene_type:complete
MPIPTNISNNAATIYEASLMYEQNAKCGTTEVITAGDAWESSTLGETAWKIVILSDATEISTLAANNIIAADCTKLVAITWEAGLEIMGEFTNIEISAGDIIIYKDCPQS